MAEVTVITKVDGGGYVAPADLGSGTPDGTTYLRGDSVWAVPPAGGTPPTGTGFRHITAGAEDAASKLVDTADVNNAQITLAKMANLAQDQFIGRITASTGVPETATITAAARTVLDDATVGAMLTTMGGATLASPTFTGTPAAPTAAADTNTTQVATTAYVLAQASTQAQQEAGPVTVNFTTPGRQHFHPSAVKCWGRFNVAGGITASYNITSVADTGTGVIAVTIGTDFSGAGVYAAQVSIEATATTWAVANAREAHLRSATLAAGTVSLDCIDKTATTNLVKDPSSWHFSAYGDL